MRNELFQQIRQELTLINRAIIKHDNQFVSNQWEEIKYQIVKLAESVPEQIAEEKRRDRTERRGEF